MSLEHKPRLGILAYIVGLGCVLTCVLSCLLGYAWYYNLDGPDRDIGQRRATPLIKALDAYRKEAGVYPVDLQELVPDYLSVIPRPAWRHEYLYMASESRDRFSINFEERGQARGDGFCGYQSITMIWQCTDSSLTYPYEAIFKPHLPLTVCGRQTDRKDVYYL